MVNTHHITIKNPPYAPCLDFIKKCIKTVEGRKCSSIYLNIKIGDIIVFHDTRNEKNIVYCEVTYVNKYDTLEDYLKHETYQIALPWVKSFDEAYNLYNKFYPLDVRNDAFNKYGCAFLGIGVKVINKNGAGGKYITYKKHNSKKK